MLLYLIQSYFQLRNCAGSAVCAKEHMPHATDFCINGCLGLLRTSNLPHNLWIHLVHLAAIIWPLVLQHLVNRPNMSFVKLQKRTYIQKALIRTCQTSATCMISSMNETLHVELQSFKKSPVVSSACIASTVLSCPPWPLEFWRKFRAKVLGWGQVRLAAVLVRRPWLRLDLLTDMLGAFRAHRGWDKQLAEQAKELQYVLALRWRQRQVFAGGSPQLLGGGVYQRWHEKQLQKHKVKTWQQSTQLWWLIQMPQSRVFMIPFDLQIRLQSTLQVSRHWAKKRPVQPLVKRFGFELVLPRSASRANLPLWC